jgi:hypothetical protein
MESEKEGKGIKGMSVIYLAHGLIFGVIICRNCSIGSEHTLCWVVPLMLSISFFIISELENN